MGDESQKDDMCQPHTTRTPAYFSDLQDVKHGRAVAEQQNFLRWVLEALQQDLDE